MNVIEQGMIDYLRYRASDDGISIFPWQGCWEVRWRDFSSVKQDRHFATEEEARAFAIKVRYEDIGNQLCNLCEEDALLSAQFWSELRK